ncbi:metal-dependent transcriptional regulator [Natronorubrum sp. JWXQ-INN-674]|uniref:Metal-dependent transcriptional regulator n=1 Tax=Natronorubrum halalkaliphilum TaxID=2691917 RepID=A0A6B0VNA9_9EURY|nr:metal-dependent transcriptional regulator [Natronorubrum halalkaliphilum]MXV62049.1 metal-dependent transcriptional regulator [Natronorubrum halalkaliphilum]
MDLSPIAEDYLKTIYHLEDENGRPVRTGDISTALDVTSPTVTSMLDSLDERELVDYTPYKGVELTDRGTETVLQLVRNHRLLETFLMEHLDYSWSAVHDEADCLEHYVSDEFTRRLATFLGEPVTDPHGDLIPDSDLKMPEKSPYTALTEYEPGDTVTVEQVPHRDPDVRDYLSRHRIGPGTQLVVDEVSSIDLVTVVPSTTETSVALPTHVARRIGARVVTK